MSQVYQLMHRESFESTQSKLREEIASLDARINDLIWQRDHLKHVCESHERHYREPFQVAEAKECGTWIIYECILYSDCMEMELGEAAKTMNCWSTQFSHLNIVVVQHLNRLRDNGCFASSLGVMTSDAEIAGQLQVENGIRVMEYNNILEYPMLLSDPFHLRPEQIQTLRDYTASHSLKMPEELHMYYNTTFWEDDRELNLFSARAILEQKA